MKRVLACALLALGIAAVGSAPATAQIYGQSLGEIYLSFDPVDRVHTQDVAPFSPFSFYLIVDVDYGDIGLPEQNASNGLSAWEAQVDVPAALTVIGRTMRPVTSIDVGVGNDNWIVGTGTPILANTTPFVVVEYVGLLVTPGLEDLALSIGPSDPTSFDDPGSPGLGPGWAEFRPLGECPSPAIGCIRLFAGSDSRMVVNCVNEPECNPSGNGLEIVVGDGAVGVGTVDVPVTVQRVDLLKVGDPADLAGLDLTIDFDGSLASVSEVLLAPATSDWLMEFNAGAGTVDISMASLNSIDVPQDQPLQVLTLRFDAPGTEGQTPLTVTDSQAFDRNQEAIPHRTVDGSLTTGCEKGDVVMDGEVNSADAIRTLFFAMDLLVPTLAELCAADMNSDGTIDVGDAVLVLQKAVGIVPAAPAGATPFLSARSGSGLGDVILFVENAAGLELELSFDPAEVSFQSASAPGSGGLTLANDKDPGAVKIGFAKATTYSGEIHLRFDVAVPHSTMVLKNAVAYDEYGARQEVTLGVSEFIFGVTAVEGDLKFADTQLLAPYPNPFNPMTELRFVLASPGDATLTVFDPAGRAVRELRLGGLAAGPHSTTWDGRDDAGQRVASGAYLIRLESGGRSDTDRVMLLK